MRLHLTSYHRYWLFIWFFVLVYLLLGDTVFSKELIHSKNFSNNQYGISYIFPLGRTELGRESQTILQEPVYITAYAPLRYAKGTIQLRFADSPKGWSIGLNNGPGFSYTLVLLDENVIQKLSFNLRDAYYDNNRIRFIFSNPDKSEGFLIVQEVLIVLDEPYGGLSLAIKENLMTTYEYIATIF